MLADICVVLIVAICIYTGYKSGFLRSFIRIASYLISLVISFFLYPIVADFLAKTPIYTKLSELIGEKYIMQGVTQTSGAETFGILTKYIGEGITNAASGIADSVAMLLINIIAFILILVLSKLIIRIVSKVLNIFTKLPVIKQFNRLGGAVLGGVLGVLLLYIISAVLILFLPIDSQTTVMDEIEKSVFASEIYENNIILDLIGKE